MVEKTIVPQIELVHRIERECTAHTLVHVWFEYMLVDLNPDKLQLIALGDARLQLFFVFLLVCLDWIHCAAAGSGVLRGRSKLLLLCSFC